MDINKLKYILLTWDLSSPVCVFAAFNFFVDKEMQSFYRRFVRDYLRYKDEIQCSGHEVLKLVREDARAHNLKLNNPGRNGSSTPDDTFYALHIRRGDFQYKVRR